MDNEIKKSKFSDPIQEDTDDNEKELDDEIKQYIVYNIFRLSKIPKVTYKSEFSKFEIPKPSTIKKLKKFDPIDWKNYFPNTRLIDEKIPIYWSGNSGPNIICLHGAGHSGLSFAPLTAMNKNYRFITFDFRGHGFNTMSEGEDLSKETLISDTLKVFEYIDKLFPEESMIIVGHSMGGSIATKSVAEILKNQEKYQSLFKKIQGLIVIDVVEGTAMEALPYMENIVKTRKSRFKSLEDGVEYMVKSGTIKNLESARISVPPLLKEFNGKDGITSYVWKTNLLASQKFWPEWFEGLTKCFLSVKIPKILLLAACDRMDKDLTIAQMQGKFKLSIANNTGHIIHEDDPSETYKLIDDFITNFRIAAKVDDIKPIIGKLGGVSTKIIKYVEDI